MERKERLDLLRKVLAGDDISAMIIPSTDPHFGEYIPDHYKVLEWLSGFTGEAATLVVTQKEAALWVDSRFFIQAAAQLEGSGIEMMRLKVEGTPSIAEWLKARLEADDIVAMDEDLFSYSEYMEMMDSLTPLSPALIEDPFDKVWKDRPALQFNPVRYVDESISGDIDLSGRAEQLQVSTTSGDVQFSGALQAVKTDSASGDVILTCHTLPEQAQVQSKSGDVELSIPDEAGFSLQYSVVSGDMESEFPLIGAVGGKSGNAVYLDGGRSTFHLSTVSGDIALRKI